MDQKTTKSKKPVTEVENKPELHRPPEHLNKMQIIKKFKASDKQFVDDKYDSGDEKEVTMDFDKEIKGTNIQGVNIVFLIDTTGSMSHFMQSIKELIRKIIRDCENYCLQFQKNKNLIKVAIVAYRDHGDENQKDGYITKKFDFTDTQKARENLKGLVAKGGSDKAEAVLDGLADVASLKWEPKSKKFLFHFLDGAPHGTEFGNGGDEHPNGCPCGKSMDDVFPDIRELIDFKYIIIKLNKDIDKMIDEFTNQVSVEVVKLEIPYEENEKKTQFY